MFFASRILNHHVAYCLARLYILHSHLIAMGDLYREPTNPPRDIPAFSVVILKDSKDETSAIGVNGVRVSRGKPKPRMPRDPP